MNTEAINKMISHVFTEKNTDYFHKNFEIRDEALTQHLTDSLNDIYTVKSLPKETENESDDDTYHINLRSLWAGKEDATFLRHTINAELDQFSYVLKAFENYTQHNNNFYPTSYIKSFLIFSLYDMKKPSEKEKIKMICESTVLNKFDNPCDMNWELIHTKGAVLTDLQKNAKMSMSFLFTELIEVYAEIMAKGFIAMSLFKEEKSVIENFVSDDIIKKTLLRMSGYKVSKNLSLRDYKNIKLSDIDSEIIVKKYGIKLLIDISYHHTSQSRFKRDLNEILKTHASESELTAYVINSLYCMDAKITRDIKKTFPEIIVNINENHFDSCKQDSYCLGKGVSNFMKATEQSNVNHEHVAAHVKENFFSGRAKEERRLLRKDTSVKRKDKSSVIRL